MIEEKTKRILSIVETILNEDGIFAEEAIRGAMNVLRGNGKPQKGETMILLITCVSMSRRFAWTWHRV